ncbi:O-methyltransferase [Aestuariibaculum sediminum]|uniref:Class I SAM-dependent methyltransferase n=1 Tax=Aestuariibaculum sediminum TaxID=2770637 RepID=A0A8J6QK56_9FLAO|nr:class I SAM-dependent methyltransferase [Aestuariibaculum sediminum]MBD0833079.1 class I SAM-dependent methyltransferase [Aestuariibaculum sediminum]
MIYQISQYIKFLFRSTNQHGVHSPFVYNLVTKCFYNRKKHPDYQKISDFKKHLLLKNESLTITDLGAGSNVCKQNTRPLKHVAKYSGTTIKRAQLLYRLMNYLKIKSALELGTSLGIATQAMALAKDLRITTVEGCTNTYHQAKKNLLPFKNITLVNSEFEAAINALKNDTYDLIFFDGNHSKKATLKYFESLIKSKHNDSVFIFDDIYWSKDMTEAWETIKQHPEVKVTIDTFYWGFVFFRKEQEKEHFTIRC